MLRCVLFSAVLVTVLACVRQQRLQAEDVEQNQRNARSAVLAKRQGLERGCSQLRSLALAEAPQHASAVQLAAYDNERQLAQMLLEQCDDALQRLQRAENATPVQLHSLSELGETESLRVQLALDRLNTFMSMLRKHLGKPDYAARRN